jgi:hypothetical protein
MNNLNSPALFRSLVVYAICVPLAITVGYLLTDLQDYESMGFIGVLVAILIFPVLMKWHYPLLIFSIGCPITLFFLPGKPSLFITMVAVSLSISVVESILNRDKHPVPAGGVRWTLLALLLVVILTAKLTGGIGLHSLGSNVYGGKKYATLFIGILSFFAITAQPIPKHKVNRYILLFFAGGFLSFISDVYVLIPEPLHFIYLFIPPTDRLMDNLGNMEIEFGVSRMYGVAATASAVVYWMLARYGIREIFMTGKLWRPLLFGLSFVLVFLGGFRSAIISIAMITGILFVLEKLHRSILMLPVVLFGIMGSVALVPLAPHLPFIFQRSLAFLPLNIDPSARLDAEASTQWRLDMWSALLPQIPQYLLLGKGYSFSAETFNEYMGRGATFKSLDAGEGALALSSDFHSGPLSVVISFGIWGVLAWLAYWVAGFRVVWRNYHYGDPQLRQINLYLFAAFVCKCFGFLFIFGGIVDDVAGFASLIGLSLALNYGVARPQPEPKAVPDAAKPRLPLPARPALQG